MTFEAIENLSFTELKEQREAIATALETLDAAECRKRYLQARMDAKQRDEKLAEQGKTITLLQSANDQTAELLTVAKIELDTASQRLRSAHEESGQLEIEIERLRGLLRSETDRAERLKLIAHRHNNAITAVAKLANDAISMSQIEQADVGE